MKKYILTFVFLLFSVPLFAQQLWWEDTLTDGTHKKVLLGNFVKTVVNGRNTYYYAPLPVDMGFPRATLEAPFSAMGYPTELIGLTDTVTTRVDTTIISGHDSYIKGTIKADDSLEVSIDGAFTAGKTWIITETTPLEISWAINQNQNKLYIRRYGASGTVRYYLRLSAL